MKTLMIIAALTLLAGCATDPATAEARRQALIQAYQAGWRPYQIPVPQQSTTIHCRTVGSDTYCN